MSFIAAAVTIGGGLIAAKTASNSADKAAAAQTASADASIEEQRRQFDLVQELLGPFAEGGTDAFQGQLALAGLAGDEAQQAAIQNIEGGAQFNELFQQSENALLQNASATGGLRGGNTQSALAELRPQLLSGLIDKQFSQLGGLSSLGQASAAQTGAAAQSSANQISNLYGQQGAAQAGAALASGQAASNLIGTATGAIGSILGGTSSDNVWYKPF